MAFAEPVLRAMKTIHVVAAVLFTGNVIVTGVWAALFFRARRQSDFRIAARAIVLTDWLFTVGGAAFLVTTGVLLAVARGYPIWGTRWIREAVIGLVLSTVLWLVILVPAQRRMVRLDPAQDDELREVFRRWNVAGWLATVPLLWALWSMTYKPT
jgi:uncharacterized membrane protein